ncbi:MAG: peptide chain release factor N(5)-glutamine methyltransferase [Elusimicrobia bacterium]|nr:peptide chain release factor N(5)-glutamine methyltransferase [Elusimicrobiota bacterium]
MTVDQLRRKAQEHLASCRVPEEAANAELILAYVLECRRPELRLNGARPLTGRQEHQAWHLVLERSRRIPLAYVLGSQEFMGLDIKVSPSVLIPRPETEELVAAAVDLVRRAPAVGRAAQVLDIGTGSGCVSVALAHLLPEAQIVATDISPAALALAEENARRHQLGRRIRIMKADLFHPGKRTSGWADVAVSNPPYIPTKELARLEPEVLREPRLALDGGPDGLAAIRAIVAEAPADLRPGGWLLLEIGHGQGPAVRQFLAKAGYTDIDVRKDAQGVPRIASARRPGAP